MLPQPLAEEMLAHETLEIRKRIPDTPETEERLGPHFLELDPQFLEASDLGQSEVPRRAS